MGMEGIKATYGINTGYPADTHGLVDGSQMGKDCPCIIMRVSTLEDAYSTQKAKRDPYGTFKDTLLILYGI